MIDLLHRLALADHVVRQVRVGNQPFVFALKVQNVSDILNRHRRDGRHGRYQLKVVFVKTNVGHIRDEINNAQ